MPSEGTGGCSVILAAKEGCVVDASEETSCELGDSGVAGMVGPFITDTSTCFATKATDGGLVRNRMHEVLQFIPMIGCATRGFRRE